MRKPAILFIVPLLALAFALVLTGHSGSVLAADAPKMPPVSGPSEPRVTPIKGDDGLYHQSWFLHSFLDLKEDYAEAKSKGRRFAVIFEQRGCIYCAKMHTDVLSQRYINDYVRENFTILQLDLWGAREVTDFDGKTMPEKKLVERWGILFTPTIVFFKDDIAAEAGKWGRPLEVARLPLGFGPNTFYDLFAWIRTKTYKTDVNFQRFHVARMTERDALKAKGAPKD
ncbi:MAG: thioredoxin family protein [Hyphomicrobiaceae bacterium]